MAIPALRQNPGTYRAADVPFMDPGVHFPTFAQYWVPFPWGAVRSGITNTCNFDSFLAHLIWMHRRDPTYFAKNLNLFNSRAENAIKALVGLYWMRIPQAFAMSTRAHFIWRNMLLHDHNQQQPFLGTTRDGPGGDAVVNMAGSHKSSVFAPLSDSSLMWFVHTCYCRESADPSDRFETVLAADIGKLVSGEYDTRKSKLKCKACEVPFNSRHRPLVSPSTWFVHFPADHDDGRSGRPIFRLREIPTIIRLPELRTGREIEFELGFVAYGTIGSPRNPLTHATSIHWIDNNYFMYDGMISDGALRFLEDGKEPPASMGQSEYVMYFRK